MKLRMQILVGAALLLPVILQNSHLAHAMGKPRTGNSRFKMDESVKNLHLEQLPVGTRLIATRDIALPANSDTLIITSSPITLVLAIQSSQEARVIPKGWMFTVTNLNTEIINRGALTTLEGRSTSVTAIGCYSYFNYCLMGEFLRAVDGTFQVVLPPAVLAR